VQGRAPGVGSARMAEVAGRGHHSKCVRPLVRGFFECAQPFVGKALLFFETEVAQKGLDQRGDRRALCPGGHFGAGDEISIDG